MKKLITFLTVMLAISSYAQPPRGDEGKGIMHPPREKMGEKGNIFLENIPELTSQQKQNVTAILTDEWIEVMKLMNKIYTLTDYQLYDFSEKEKQDKERHKILKKINKIETKSDKKIKKMLSVEQFCAYLEKRHEFKFRKPDRPFPCRENESKYEESYRPPFLEPGGFDSNIEESIYNL